MTYTLRLSMLLFIKYTHFLAMDVTDYIMQLAHLSMQKYKLHSSQKYIVGNKDPR